MFLKDQETQGIYKLIEDQQYQEARCRLNRREKNAEEHFLEGLILMNTKPSQAKCLRLALTEFTSAINKTPDMTLKLYCTIQLAYTYIMLSQLKNENTPKICGKNAMEKALDYLKETKSLSDFEQHCESTAFVWIDLLRLYNQFGYLQKAYSTSSLLSDYYQKDSENPTILTLQAEIKLAKVIAIFAKYRTATVDLNAFHYQAINMLQDVLNKNSTLVSVETVADEYQKLLSRAEPLDSAAYCHYQKAATKFQLTYSPSKEESTAKVEYTRV